MLISWRWPCFFRIIRCCLWILGLYTRMICARFQMKQIFKDAFWFQIRNSKVNHLCMDQGMKENHTATLHPCHGWGPQVKPHSQQNGHALHLLPLSLLLSWKHRKLFSVFQQWRDLQLCFSHSLSWNPLRQDFCCQDKNVSMLHFSCWSPESVPQPVIP